MKANRSFSHWSPRYVADRLLQILWMRKNNKAPWLTREAVIFIEQWLRPDDLAIEWGSGRSTAWFAQRVGKLLSVEHHSQWYKQVINEIDKQGLKNVDYRLVERIGNELLDAEKYSQEVLLGIEEGSLDFALVDGIFRDSCALAVLSKLKPGGLLLIDDAHRYLPSNSRSPNAIPGEESCSTAHWEKFLAVTQDWRTIWFSDGIHDDVLYFKPYVGH